MKVTKKKLMEMFRCYAASTLTIDGRICPVLATEGEGAACYFTGADFDERHFLWEAPGGTMSFVEIPGKPGEFLAVQNFFPTFQAEHSTIVWGRQTAKGGWDIRTVLDLPYVHRFDILEADGELYFLGATLCTSKTEKEDWSDPGKVYVGKLPDAPGEPIELTVILEGLVKNHGYSRTVWEGRNAALVTCDNGVFLIRPPVKGGEWAIEQLMDIPTSDIAALDIDGDGELELATIAPFHGNTFSIYKKMEGTYRQVYQYPVVEEFYHVVKACHLRGVPTIVGGCRRGPKQLFILQWNADTASFEATVLDEGVGPSNVDVINEEGRDVIVSANRELGEAALYFVED